MASALREGSDRPGHLLGPISLAVHMKLAWPLKTNILILTVIILLCNNPVTPLIRAPDKRGIEENSKIIFLLSQ